MIARKLDSDFTITKRMINRQVRKAINEAVPELRNANFVQNYVFSGAGSGGFSGGGGVAPGRTTGIVYDPANPGSTIIQTRGRIEASHGAYLQDDPGNDAINIVADSVNDPMFWLRGGI